MTESVTELKKLEKVVVKLRNKMNRSDLNYTVQVSINSTDPTKIAYAAQITAPANGLAPVTFISYESIDDLIKIVKEATKTINYDEIEKAYHRAQVEACQRTIEFHEERVKAIDNPEPEAPQVEEGEVTLNKEEQPNEQEAEATDK